MKGHKGCAAAPSSLTKQKRDLGCGTVSWLLFRRWDYDQKAKKALSQQFRLMLTLTTRGLTVKRPLRRELIAEIL
jgi:hypothetical protein